jgi:hypothetical protein
MNTSEALSSYPGEHEAGHRDAPGRRASSLDELVAHAGGSPSASVPTDCGERRLRWAVLIDAIAIYRGGTEEKLSAKKRVRWLRERKWILSDDTSWPFSFVSICDALDLDPPYIRRLVFRATKEGRDKWTHRHLSDGGRRGHLQVRRGNLQAVS